MSRQVIIGVATVATPFRGKHKDGDLFRPTEFFCEMARHAIQSGAQVVLLHPTRTNWDGETVVGFSPADTKKPYGNWKRVTVRFPDVIYENVFVHLAVKGEASTLRRTTLARHRPLFNPPLPSKWKMVNLLSGTSLGHYVPKTTRLDDVEAAVRCIDKWGTTYVKPVGGYGGAGVTRIEPLGQNRYRLCVDRTMTSNQPVRKEITKQELCNILKSRKKHAHLVQRGLHLMTIRGRKVDFRVVVGRDRQGEWQLIGIIPKIAARDGVVTNIVAGGNKISLQECVRLAKQEGKHVDSQKLEQCALEIARFLSRRSPMCGLLGFDIGLEENGKVYMIEMNPKPARSLLAPEMRRRSARYQVEFALYLAERHRSM